MAVPESACQPNLNLYMNLHINLQLNLHIYELAYKHTPDPTYEPKPKFKPVYLEIAGILQFPLGKNNTGFPLGP